MLPVSRSRSRLPPYGRGDGSRGGDGSPRQWLYLSLFLNVVLLVIAFKSRRTPPYGR